MNRIKCIYGLLLCVLYANAFTVPFEGLYPLQIIHYNDFHARFEETSVETPTCRFNNNSCLGGFPRLYHEIQVLLQEKPDAVLLNAGDSFQGTYWYTLLKWNITAQFMNLLPHDAHAIGNHEFDDGPAGLAPYLAALKAPVLAANMDVSDEPTLQGLFQPSIVVTRQRRRIGIIGLITEETRTLSNPGNVVFTDPREATKREAEALMEKGVDIIILLSHCGLDVDKELARDYGQYIDVIVGGHTHSLLWNGEAPSNETVAGAYPIIIQPSADLKHNVLIVQASAFTKYMGNLTVYFDYKGDFVYWDGGPIYLNRSIEEDKSIKEKLAPYAELVHQAETVGLGYTNTTLRYEDCVYGECALGDLLTDALNDHAKSRVKSDLPYVSIIQRGNIKSTINEGEITKGDIFELLPYLDRVESFQLQGIHLKDALERSVSSAWATDPFKGPYVLQVSGLQVAYNISQPEGKRITFLSVGGEEINIDRYYQVTAPAFLAGGGDGFTMLKNKLDVNIVGKDQDIVEDYIKKHTPINIKVDGRIKITS